jgi:hypothetical protein
MMISVPFAVYSRFFFCGSRVVLRGDMHTILFFSPHLKTRTTCPSAFAAVPCACKVEMRDIDRDLESKPSSVPAAASSPSARADTSSALGIARRRGDMGMW